MYTYKAKLIRIIDGDTVDAEIDLGFGVFVKQRIRLYGIATPDAHSADAETKQQSASAKQRLTEIMTREFKVLTILNKRGKLGRTLGMIYVLDENNEQICVNDQMVADGHAVAYSTGKEE
jgi:micrococcal nuclease